MIHRGSEVETASEGSSGQGWLQFGLGIMAAAVALPVIWASYLGSFSRYLADDFCTAGTLREMGFSGSQVYWYQSWSGRFSFTFLVSLTHLAGPRLTPWLPGIFLVVALGALMLLMLRLSGLLRMRGSWLAAFVLAATCLVAMLAAAPNLYQAVLWQTGLITYGVPLAILAGYAAWLLWLTSISPIPTRRAALLLVSGVIPFIAGGFSETFVSVQTAGLIVAIGATLLFLRGERRRWLAQALGCGLAGSLLALTLVALAPGNAVRQGLMPEPPGLMLLLQRTWHDAYVFGVRMLRGSAWSLFAPFVVAFGLSVDGLRAEDIDSGGRWRGFLTWLAGLMGVSLAALAMLLATMAPSEYALSAYPDGRVMITGVFVVVMAAGLGGVFFAGLTRRLLPLGRKGSAVLRALSSAAAATLLAVLVVVSMQRAAVYLGDAQGFAAAWDSRDRAIHAALARGENEIPVASLTHMAGLAEVSRDPNDWVNRCLADAYGLKRVTAK